MLTLTTWPEIEPNVAAAQLPTLTATLPGGLPFEELGAVQPLGIVN